MQIWQIIEGLCTQATGNADMVVRFLLPSLLSSLKLHVFSSQVQQACCKVLSSLLSGNIAESAYILTPEVVQVRNLRLCRASPIPISYLSISSSQLLHTAVDVHPGSVDVLHTALRLLSRASLADLAAAMERNKFAPAVQMQAIRYSSFHRLGRVPILSLTIPCYFHVQFFGIASRPAPRQSGFVC